MGRLNDKTTENLNDIFEHIEGTPSGDDKGITIKDGDLSIGEYDNPKNSYIGGGDSYNIPIAFHCTIANTSGLTITSATNITTILQSDEGSNVGLFNGVSAGNYVLVGSPVSYAGVYVKIDASGTVEPENVIAEYLKDDTPTWSAVSYMVKGAETRNFRGLSLASGAEDSEHWRFGLNPLEVIPNAWDQVTLNINGVDYENYKWARFRITSDITLDPIIEHAKLHSNHTKVNSDGTVEYFGLARYPDTVLIEKYANASKNPSNQNISLSSGITIVREDNEFANSASDGFILKGIIPEGMDTSIPVQVIIDWYPNTTGSGDVELESEVVKRGSEFTYDGSAVAVALTPVITSIDNQQYENQRSVFLVNVSAAEPGDHIYGSLFRDAIPSNTDDTYEGSIIIEAWNVVGYFCQ